LGVNLRKETKKMKKKLFALTMIVVLVLSLGLMTGCGEKADNVLVVGLDDTFAPMGFRDEENNLVGFDIDLANAVCEELGVAAEFVPINWDAKELELTSKNIDCIWNGMSATPERMESMSLSYKYLNNKIVIMALDENVAVASAEDLANYNIGTQADSAALETMKADAGWDTFAANVTEYKTYDQALMDMQAGRLDCIVVDQVLGEYKNSKLQEKMSVCEYDFGDDYYAIGFRAEDKELTDKVNAAIQTLIDNGTAADISNTWFGKDIVVFEPTYEE
jgi:polar amino acid transport system substrate-binding protein